MIFVVGRVLLPLFLLIAVPSVTPSQAHADNSGEFLGELLNGKYRNGFFGFRLSLPPEMYVLSDQEKDIYKKAGVEMFTKDAKKGGAALEKAASQETLLFFLTVSKPGSTGVSSLGIGALKQPDGVTPALVSEAAADFFVRNPHYKLVSRTKTLERALQNFARVELKFANGEQTISIRYYATIRRGYSITFVISYRSQADLDSLEKVLDSLEFS